jgi:hypothetical protein
MIMRRILTIQVEIVDKMQAEWIWNNHMKNDSCHGVLVTAIHEGPIVKSDESEYQIGDEHGMV